MIFSMVHFLKKKFFSLNRTDIESLHDLLDMFSFDKNTIYSILHITFILKRRDFPFNSILSLGSKFNGSFKSIGYYCTY